MACVMEFAAGFATEETLEATVLGAFLFPIMIGIGCKSCFGPLVDQQETFNSSRLLFFCCLSL